MRPSILVRQVGGRYARQLGIELPSGASKEIYKWFIASVLFGARISGNVAMHAYKEFERADLLSPAHMLKAGWDALVRVLDGGGYVRYDFKTATKLLEVNRSLLERYGGDLNALHESAADAADLEHRLKGLGKGIGDVTVNIFLRELRGVWKKAHSLPSVRAIGAAKALGYVPEGMSDPAHVLQALENAWRADRMRQRDFADFEAALVRYEAASRRQDAQPQARKLS